MTGFGMTLRSNMHRTTANRAVGSPPTATEILHRIRARVKQVMRDSARQHTQSASIELLFAELLKQAIAAQSPFEITVALGSAAELMIFPDERLLEECTNTVEITGHYSLRGVL